MSVMDPALLARLIDAHAPALVLYARQWCDAPEDVVQDAFLKLVAQPRLPEHPVPWLFRVVRNRAISVARSARRRQRHECAAATRAPPWFLLSADRDLDGEAARRALAELPLEQREAIVAHLWGELTFEQIGELAACSTSMAYRRFTAGVATLRARMGVPCSTRRPNPT
jgi:RNA polymerase sigma-70 factor (ECF subfamily)